METIIFSNSPSPIVQNRKSRLSETCIAEIESQIEDDRCALIVSGCLFAFHSFGAINQASQVRFMRRRSKGAHLAPAMSGCNQSGNLASGVGRANFKSRAKEMLLIWSFGSIDCISAHVNHRLFSFGSTPNCSEGPLTCHAIRLFWARCDSAATLRLNWSACEFIFHSLPTRTLAILMENKGPIYLQDGEKVQHGEEE